MLEELRVENLLLIERAELRLGPGLNVLTGETGAGKTVLARALDLLLGGKPRSGIVRPGAAEAYVEGVFVGPDGEDVVLGRRVWAEGRTRAYVGGRAATAADLAELGGALLSFYGQHEHRKLTLASAQLDILDGFCGPEQAERRGTFAEAYAAERGLARSLEELREHAGGRERELDLLNWELREIEEAAPSVEEEASLSAERERLRHAEALAGAAAAGLQSLEADTLAAAARAGEAVAGIDAGLDPLVARLSALSLEADDLASDLRRYLEGVEAEPGRLQVIEERLALLDRLKRKHGGTIEAVLAHAESCRARRDALAGADDALADGDARLAAAREDLAARATELRAARVAAGEALAGAVVERLADLAMEGATFEARVTPRADGYGPAGGDDVEFVIATNPGVPAGSLREIASGGELSRVMLALMSVAAEGSGPVTLVFDEIDAGIGGQTARAVGERLRELADGRQVIAITHLPQIASLAERHFRIAKDSTGATAHTTVTALAKKEVVGELVRMLGADAGDPSSLRSQAARRHAKELLKAA